MKKAYIIILFLLISTKCISQTIERKIINTDFFKMNKPADALYDAVLYHGLIYSYKITKATNKELKIRFQVKIDFIPSKSYFTFGAADVNDLLLIHEQGHADIATGQAKKLLIALNKNKYYSNNYMNQMQKIFASIKDSLQTEHELYDLETNHGINLENQKKWSLKLVSEITKQAL
jgi:hypothetical protein